MRYLGRPDSRLDDPARRPNGVSSRLTRLSFSYSSRCGLDERSIGSAPEVAARQLLEGRGPYSQVPAVRPRLQGETQSVEAPEVRVRRPQELLLRPVRAQLHAKCQSTPPPDAEPQLLSAAEEAVRPEDCSLKSSTSTSTSVVTQELRPWPKPTNAPVLSFHPPPLSLFLTAGQRRSKSKDFVNSVFVKSNSPDTHTHLENCISLRLPVKNVL